MKGRRYTAWYAESMLYSQPVLTRRSFGVVRSYFWSGSIGYRDKAQAGSVFLQRSALASRPPAPASVAPPVPEEPPVLVAPPVPAPPVPGAPPVPVPPSGVYPHASSAPP